MCGKCKVRVLHYQSIPIQWCSAATRFTQSSVPKGDASEDRETVQNRHLS